MALGRKLPGAFLFDTVKSFVPLPLAAASRSLGAAVCFDGQAFATKVRLVRAVFGWSQSELGRHVGLTQRATYKLEQGTQSRGAAQPGGSSIVQKLLNFMTN
jgi:hypothetical protein